MLGTRLTGGCSALVFHFYFVSCSYRSRRAHVANNLKMKPMYLFLQFNGNEHHHNIGRLYLSLDETFPHHHQSGWLLSAGVYHIHKLSLSVGDLGGTKLFLGGGEQN